MVEKEHTHYALLGIVAAVALLALYIVLSVFGPPGFLNLENLRGSAAFFTGETVEYDGETYEVTQAEEHDVFFTFGAQISMVLEKIHPNNVVINSTLPNGSVVKQWLSPGESASLRGFMVTLYDLDANDASFVIAEREAACVEDFTGQTPLCRGQSACCDGTCQELPHCDRPDGPVLSCGDRELYCCGGRMSARPCGVDAPEFCDVNSPFTCPGWGYSDSPSADILTTIDMNLVNGLGAEISWAQVTLQCGGNDPGAAVGDWKNGDGKEFRLPCDFRSHLQCNSNGCYFAGDFIVEYKKAGESVTHSTSGRIKVRDWSSGSAPYDSCQAVVSLPEGADVGVHVGNIVYDIAINDISLTGEPRAYFTMNGWGDAQQLSLAVQETAQLYTDIGVPNMAVKLQDIETPTTTPRALMCLKHCDIREVLQEGETKSLWYGNAEYEITLVFVSDPENAGPPTAKFSVNGVLSPAMTENSAYDFNNIQLSANYVNNVEDIGAVEFCFTDRYPFLEQLTPEVDGSTVQQNGMTVARCGDLDENWCQNLHPNAGEGPFEFEWDDGSYSCSWFPATHSYSNSGTYDIEVRVKNTCGLIASRTQAVAIGSVTAEYCEVSPDSYECKNFGVKSSGNVHFTLDGPYAVPQVRVTCNDGSIGSGVTSTESSSSRTDVSVTCPDVGTPLSVYDVAFEGDVPRKYVTVWSMSGCDIPRCAPDPNMFACATEAIARLCPGGTSYKPTTVNDHGCLDGYDCVPDTPTAPCPQFALAPCTPLEVSGGMVAVVDSPQSLPECTDSDGGKNYYKAGKGTGAYSDEKQIGIIWGPDSNKCTAQWDETLGTSVHYDCCNDAFANDQLHEAFCDEKGLLQSEGYNCPLGCRDGRCLQCLSTADCPVTDCFGPNCPVYMCENGQCVLVQESEEETS